jgi:hypothetical protein
LHLGILLPHAFVEEIAIQEKNTSHARFVAKVAAEDCNAVTATQPKTKKLPVTVNRYIK